MSLPAILHAGIYLSGYFTYEREIVNQKKFLPKYAFSNFLEKNHLYLSQKYYSNWLATLYPSQARMEAQGFREFSSNQLILQGSGGAHTVETPSGTISFSIGTIDIYLFREGMGVFSISILPPAESQQFATLSSLVTVLRNTTQNNSFPNHNPLPGIIETEITPWFTGDPQSWRKFNPHLRLFLNIDVDREFVSDRQFDQTLFELATAMPIGDIGTQGLYAPSQAYYDQLMSGNTINVFRNWRTLCIFDSIVRISVDLRKADSFNLWETDYYHIIIFTSFVRFYLYHTNARLSLLTDKSKEAVAIRDEYILFLNDFDLTQISYKFLPNIIYKMLIKSLEISEELKRLDQKLLVIDTAVREGRVARIENFARLIVFLSLFTILTDGVDLLEKNLGLEESLTLTRIITGSLLVFVTTLVIIVFLRNKKTMR